MGRAGFAKRKVCAAKLATAHAFKRDVGIGILQVGLDAEPCEDDGDR